MLPAFGRERITLPGPILAWWLRLTLPTRQWARFSSTVARLSVLPRSFGTLQRTGLAAGAAGRAAGMAGRAAGMAAAGAAGVLRVTVRRFSEPTPTALETTAAI